MDYLHVDEDLKQSVRKIYNITEVEIKDQVERISLWYQEQSNFPPIPGDANYYFENALLWNKFRFERTQQKIVSYYKIKSQLGDKFITGMCRVIPLNEPSMFIPLPYVTTDRKERILMWVLRDSVTANFNIEKIIHQAFTLLKLLMKYDYSAGNRFLLDPTGVQIGHIIRANPIAITKYVRIYLNNLNHKLCGVEFVNMPPIQRKFVVFFKSLFPKKLAERIRVHKDNESLHQVIPRECLPEEYDGLLECKEKIAVKFNENFLKCKDDLHKLLTLKAVNNQQNEELFDDDAENTPQPETSFKNLTID